ncbi:MAG: hypothetical protein LBF83_02365 [Spirochaetaceae bacterium]|nr:hypothetical protein [Spirochaetaceae bacterium]
MPQFISEMVARGFWWAILAGVIFGLPFFVVSVFLGKRKFLQLVVQRVPCALFLFYTWHIREHIGWLVFAILWSILVFIELVAQLREKAGGASDTFVDAFLSSCADEANKDLPEMIDSETRFDKTMALSNRIFQYHFTLINQSKEEINPEEFKNNIQPSILNNLKTNSAFTDFKNYKVTVEYFYHDKNDNEILKLTYKPNDYS